MSKPLGYSFVRDRDHAIEILDKSQRRVASLEEEVRKLYGTIDSLNSRVRKSEPKAQDFDILLKAVKENELVKSAWEKFMMTLRLTGND